MAHTTAAVEEQLLTTVGTLLSKEDITARDNFFDVGGHSILAAQLLNRMELVLGYRAPLRYVFEAEDLGELARRLADGVPAAEPIAPGAPGETGRPTER